MRVLALGGAGRYGRDVIPMLAQSDLVTEIVVAGRRLEAAERAAAKFRASSSRRNAGSRGSGRAYPPTQARL